MGVALAAHPNLTHLKHQAKQLLRAHREGRLDACATLKSLRRFGGKNDSQILAEPVALHEVQYALAMHYGFPSWNAMRKHVESLQPNQAAPTAPSLVNPTSLWATIDAIDEAFFAGRQLTRAQRREAATFIAQRQGKPGSYMGMFAPSDTDRQKGIRLFTGERIPPGAGMRHMLGEEACRALLLVDVQSPAVREALTNASRQMLSWVAQSPAMARPNGWPPPGMFCCMKCSCVLWRHLAARGEKQYEAFLAAGMKSLRRSRDGEGGWNSWPFAYTLLTLIEIGNPPAVAEIRYAADRCEVELKKRSSRTNVYSLRRRSVLERALARC